MLMRCLYTSLYVSTIYTHHDIMKRIYLFFISPSLLIPKQTKTSICYSLILDSTTLKSEEQDVPKEHLESHLTAHSSEILPGLYLGGIRKVVVEKKGRHMHHWCTKSLKTWDPQIYLFLFVCGKVWIRNKHTLLDAAPAVSFVLLFCYFDCFTALVVWLVFFVEPYE